MSKNFTKIFLKLSAIMNNPRSVFGKKKLMRTLTKSSSTSSSAMMKAVKTKKMAF